MRYLKLHFCIFNFINQLIELDMRNFIISIYFVLSIIINSFAQSKTSTTIKTEALVPEFKLPELLISENGSQIKTKETWEQVRRPEILELFANQVYGKVPGKLTFHKAEVLDYSDQALGNKAIRKQVALHFKKGSKSIVIVVLMYLPKRVKNAPVFLGYNFSGNHAVHADPAILIGAKTLAQLSPSELSKLKPDSRGKRNSRWQADKIVAAGYGLVTVDYGNVDPDKNDFSDGIHILFYEENQKSPEPHQWGSLAAWAWGMSRVMDYLETDTLVDEKSVILFGHSRLGKTALWAGASDSRFSIVISNNSGCGGAALSRRRFGEKVSNINTKFPHWFAKNFHQYNENETDLPIDQHMLIALIAPRPVYVASASLDLWADPNGEFLSAKAATPVYELYGKKGIEVDQQPAVNTPIHNMIGYHLREGKHNVTAYDWDQYIQFSNLHLH